ncbi:hypothetical protein SFRURICE_013759, partial [Spodoptera frugiperda]
MQSSPYITGPKIVFSGMECVGWLTHALCSTPPRSKARRAVVIDQYTAVAPGIQWDVYTVITAILRYSGSDHESLKTFRCTYSGSEVIDTSPVRASH